MLSRVTACPLSGQCSCRFTPRMSSGTLLRCTRPVPGGHITGRSPRPPDAGQPGNASGARVVSGGNPGASVSVPCPPRRLMQPRWDKQTNKQNSNWQTFTVFFWTRPHRAAFVRPCPSRISTTRKPTSQRSTSCTSSSGGSRELKDNPKISEQPPWKEKKKKKGSGDPFSNGGI